MPSKANAERPRTACKHSLVFQLISDNQESWVKGQNFTHLRSLNGLSDMYHGITASDCKEHAEIDPQNVSGS